MTDINRVADTLYKIYDEIAKLDSEHRRKTIDLKDQAEKLERYIRKFMVENSIPKLSTDVATFSLKDKTFANVKDWDAFYDYIRQSQDFEMLSKSIKKTEVEAYIEEHKVAPPGVEVTTEIALRKTRSR